ncbi:MAG: biosynthetic-type acetolactate synthase large subunit [Cytophagales bacterium]|nr:biosynthetic-type acetolactate synthase large subunit [Cytophagales bacterium]
MKKIQGSEAIIKSLIEESVDTIFGYPGGAIMPIYDSLYSYQDKINHILTRHEQGAIHAAQGYSRVSGKVGVCFATSGPGATNLITGIADAQIDSTPLVCITGQVPSQLLGTDAFQESDIIGISMPVTKWNYQITSSDEICQIISKAFYIARSGRPGPVLIDITKDAQFSDVIFNYKKCERIRSYHPYPIINDKKIKEASKLINRSKKPLILVGQGVLLSNAQKELLKFTDKTGIPVASTLLGLSAVSCDHKNYVGYLGMHGNYGPNVKTNEADLIIAIGMRFDDRVTGDTTKYAVNAKIIHLEIDPSEIDKIIKTDVAINADAKEALIELNKIVNNNNHDEWINEFRECDKLEFDKIINKEINVVEDKILMADVINRISNLTKGKSIIVTDVGQHQMVTSRYYKFSESNSNITSGGLGTMGFALPASLGAKIGQPKRDVIAVIGDGGIQMTIQELATISQYNIKVKILILNNNFLGMVRQWQELFFDNRYSFTEMKNPNFNIIADGYGIKNNKVENKKDLDKCLKEFINYDGSYLLNVVVEKEENVFPMVPSGESVSNIRLE